MLLYRKHEHIEDILLKTFTVIFFFWDRRINVIVNLLADVTGDGERWAAFLPPPAEGIGSVEKAEAAPPPFPELVAR